MLCENFSPFITNHSRAKLGWNSDLNSQKPMAGSRLIFLVVQSSKNYQRAKTACALALGTSPRAAVAAKLEERILLPS